MRYIILASLLFSCISAEITTHDTQETTQNDYNGGVECGLCLCSFANSNSFLNLLINQNLCHTGHLYAS